MAIVATSTWLRGTDHEYAEKDLKVSPSSPAGIPLYRLFEVFTDPDLEIVIKSHGMHHSYRRAEGA